VAFVPLPDLRAAVTAANAMRAEPLPDHWDAILPVANRRAYLKLQAHLAGRGHTPADLAAWGAGSDTQGYDWNLRLGVVLAFVEAARSDEDRGQAYRDEYAALLKELAEESIVIGGDVALPPTSGGRIGSGPQDDAADRFRLGAPDAGRFPGPGDGTRL
jgi:hypothetical protein